MIRIESLLATVLASCVIPMIASCAGTPGAPTPGAAAELAPTGALRVAVFTGPVRHPWKAKITLGRALAARAGVTATIPPVAKMVEDAKTGAWDIAVVAFDPARRSVLDFAPPHITVDLTYLVAPGSAINSVAEADRPGVKIAAARGATTRSTWSAR